jgi:hypothetical protein
MTAPETSVLLDLAEPQVVNKVARIICSYLTGKAVAAGGSYDDWLCPADDESANAMCNDMAEEIEAALRARSPDVQGE